MKKILFALLFILMASTVFAAGELTLSAVTLQSSAGTTTSGTTTLTNTITQNISGIVLNVAGNLVSGSNLLPASQIIIVPSTVSMLNASQSTSATVYANIPVGQAAGTYTGYLTATSAFGTEVGQLTVIVSSPIQTGPSFTISDVDFGSSSQVRDQTISSTVRLTNTGNQTLIISLSSTASSVYSLIFSQSTIVLAPNAIADVPITVHVPKSQNAVRTSIGGITATSTNIAGLSRTSTMYMTAENDLIVEKAKFVTSDGDSKTLDPGEEFTIKSGKEVTMTITVRNEFTEDVDMQDIRLDVKNSDLDIDESLDTGDISYDDKDTTDLTFTIPTDIDEGTYPIKVTLRGTDSNGARHGGDYKFNIRVDRKNDELTIASLTLNPTTVSCDRRATLVMDVQNTGSRNEPETSVRVDSPELNVYERWNLISLDTSEHWRKSYPFTVPSTVAPGSYDVEVTTYYNSDTQSDLNIATLIVQNCASGNTGNNNNNNNNGNTGNNNNNNNNNGNTGNNNNNNGNTGNNNNGNTVVTTPTTPQVPIPLPSGSVGPSYGESSFFSTPTYVVLLVLAILIFLTLIIILLVKFVF